MVRDTLAAAGVLGRELVVVEARSDRDFEPAFATFVKRQASALVVAPSQLFDSNRDQLLACAVKRRRFPVGASPTRQPLQPEATGAVMEVTKWLKPSDSVSRYTVTARVCRP